MVGRADDANVNVLAVLGEEFAIVGELLRFGKPLGLPLALERLAVDVADRDYVAKERSIVGVAAPLATDADAGDVELLVGRGAPGRATAGGDKVAGSDDRRGAQKRTAAGLGHGCFLSGE